MIDTNAAERRRLLQIARHLSPSETLVLQLLVVIYAPVRREDFARVAARYHSGLTNSTAILDALVQRGVVEKILPPDAPASAVPHYGARHLIREPLTQATLTSGIFHSLAGVVRETLWKENNLPTSFDHAVARARVALYQGNEKLYRDAERQMQVFFGEINRSPAAVVWEGGGSDGWLKSLPHNFQVKILCDLLNHSLFGLQPAENLLQLLVDAVLPAPPLAAAVLLAAQYLYRGKFSQALKIAKNISTEYRGFFHTWIDVLSDKPAVAYEWLVRNSSPALPVRTALHLLTQFKAGNFASGELSSGPDPLCAPLVWFAAQRMAQTAKPFDLTAETSPLAKIFAFLVWHWESDPRFDENRAELIALYERARGGGYWWLAVEAAALLAAREKIAEVEWAAKLANALKNCKCAPLVNYFSPRAEWERPLAALAAVIKEQGNFAQGEMRLIWQLNYHDGTGICEISAHQQTRLESGLWGRSKKIAWQMLAAASAESFMTEADRQISAAIYRESRERSLVYELDYDRALLALIGHPLVFLPSGARVEITNGEPELIVLKYNDGAKVQLSPTFNADEKVILVRETAARFRVARIKTAHRELVKVIGSGLIFPPAALPALKKTLGDLSAQIAVQSEIGGVGETLTEIIADSRLRAHLLPSGDDLQVEFFVRPFGERGNYYRPGGGASLLIGEFNGERVRTVRNLAAEIVLLERVIADCPALQNAVFVEHSWQFIDPLDSLEFLVQLQKLNEIVIPEWTHGWRRRVENSPQFSRVNVVRRHDWFEITGDIKINEQLTLSLQEILKLAENAVGRFLKISDDQYLALTESFQQQLSDLAAYGDNRADGLRLPTLAAVGLQDLAKEVSDFQADLAWKQLISKLKMPTQFALPANLQCELRDYQRRGFDWLANLAEWQFGACLADDMGLGKTVQTLALLLHRAELGAALIVAPTSVCFNWQQEAARFAPSLKVEIFGGGDRAAMIAAAGKNSLIICSYALLRQTENLFVEKHWATAVLDEAQAIKNSATKASQAVMKISADFRMLTTGTPIENHLGELWNLFNFLNRGLLGSQKRFQERFAIPIEREQNEVARERLKKLLKPFILRRVKGEVLKELPPRTEILKSLPPNEEEIAFYEAIRREAVEKLQAVSGNSGERQLRILAEIMRLRRACCHPRLLVPDSKIMSSKLTEFAALIAGLRENEHRALVFSQFVDHLALVREFLDREKISYQYLDGSTPEKLRRVAVEKFQNGEGDLFLISLKAGGQGLNLTAADFVIHLDPWWNPAVEDQASDRAHRIGQTKPVTIYRLVLQNTIEEKIVRMHAHKRRLAEGILSDGDLGKINAEELLKLIREND